MKHGFKNILSNSAKNQVSSEIMNKNLLILGMGGHGHVVADIARATGLYNKIDFLDDNNRSALGKLKDYKQLIESYQYAFVAIGNAEIRAKLIPRLELAGYLVKSIIHPTVIISPSAEVGNGTVVSPYVVIGPDVKVGKGCIIGCNADLEHGSSVGDYAYIRAGAIVCPNVAIESNYILDYSAVAHN